jgi:geranyl-CoA carboxylase alpha subunit
MNGRVAAVLVKQGESVTAGQPVITLEAMKMEHILRRFRAQFPPSM